MKTVLMLFMLMLLAAGNAFSENVGEAELFYSKFRKAVLDQDFAKITSLTKFPFEIRGVDDGQPVEYYTRNTFRTAMERSLSAPVVGGTAGKIVIRSMAQILREKKSLVAKDYVTRDFIRIEQFEFHKLRGTWFFTRTYLEE